MRTSAIPLRSASGDARPARGGTSAVIHASELITAASKGPKRSRQMDDLGLIKDGAVAFAAGRILAVGPTKRILKEFKPRTTIDARGKTVLPGFVDAHTHLVFAGSRHEEYASRIAGTTYAQAHQSGGIRYTVKLTRAASDKDLTAKALRDLDTMLLHGTTTLEAKSGYGLDLRHELRLLKLINRLKDLHPMGIVTTFLGAHSVPKEYLDDKHGYLKLVKKMLPQAAKLATFCDAWCDPLGFDAVSLNEILSEAKRLGMDIKLHAEQSGNCQGAELAAANKAISADHLDHISNHGIDAMQRAGTIAVLLPGVNFHQMAFNSVPPVDKLLHAGIPIAIASDYNPGSSPTPSMQMILALACRLFKMTYAQAINAATINAAWALDLGRSVGSLEPGKAADITIFSCPSHGMIIDRFGVNQVDTVIKAGRVVAAGQRVVK